MLQCLKATPGQWPIWYDQALTIFMFNFALRNIQLGAGLFGEMVRRKEITQQYNL